MTLLLRGRWRCVVFTWWLGALLGCLLPATTFADTGPDVSVRVGTHDGYGRVVFDMPTHTDYHVTQQDQHVVIQFNGGTTIGTVAKVPRNVVSIAGGKGQAELVIAPRTVVRDWRLGDRIVIDVWDQASAPRPREGSSSVVSSGSPPATQQATGPPGPPPPAPPPVPTVKPPEQSAPPKAEAPAVPPKPEATAAKPDTPPASAQAAPQPSPQASPNPAADAPAAPAEPQAAPTSPASDTAEEAEQKPDSVLVVPTDNQAGVAAFRRRNSVLIVFDRPLDIDMAPLRDDPVFGAATVQQLSTATTVRVRLDPNVALSVSRDTDAWRISPVTDEPKLQPIAANSTGDSLNLSATAPGSVVSILDPDGGGTLLVGTQRRAGQGVPVQRQSAYFTLLPTWQGVAVEPHADTLTLQATEQGFVVTNGTGGLAMSPPSDIADQLAHSAGLTREFDFPSQPTDLLMQRLRREVASDSATPALARGPRRFDVARTMISLGLGVEAQAVLRVAASDDPRAADSARNGGLGSIAALMAYRPDEAIGLSDPRLPAADDLALWRAVQQAELHEGSPQAAAVLAATLPLLLSYPAEMRDRVLPLVAETLIAGGEKAVAAALLDARKNDASLDLARGMLREAQGDTPGALAIYDRLARSQDQLQHARASARAVELRLAKGELNTRQAADQLDSMLYAWRGDSHEQALRERVAQLRAKAGQWRAALSLLRETEALFPDDKAAIRNEMQQMFAELLRQNATATLPPLEFVSLVEENADLLPSGAEGEALQARLADQMLALDLPKSAGPVLEKLMQAAPSLTSRAGFGARLAALRLRDDDAAGALAALSASDASDLPGDLAERRVLLAAAANSRRGDNAGALAALGKLHTPAADEARATILERQNDWPAAQRALSTYTDKTVPTGGPLNDVQRRTLLRFATAAARSGDNAQLATLRERDGSRMGSGPLADMFRLLTADQVRSVADLRRSGQEAALARALPANLKAIQAPAGQTP